MSYTFLISAMYSSVSESHAPSSVALEDVGGRKGMSVISFRVCRIYFIV
jgi:hypothetical protein